IAIMLWSQVANGVLLPFILIFMLILINNKDIMGRFTNSRVFNAVSWATTVIMIALTVLLVAISIFPNLLA
ncbi:MAG: divalent metal cation transporter, partial [Thermacetogeniaceae bacterium]